MLSKKVQILVAIETIESFFSILVLQNLVPFQNLRQLHVLYCVSLHSTVAATSRSSGYHPIRKTCTQENRQFLRWLASSSDCVGQMRKLNQSQKFFFSWNFRNLINHLQCFITRINYFSKLFSQRSFFGQRPSDERKSHRVGHFFSIGKSNRTSHKIIKKLLEQTEDPTKTAKPFGMSFTNCVKHYWPCWEEETLRL